MSKWPPSHRHPHVAEAQRLANAPPYDDDLDELEELSLDEALGTIDGQNREIANLIADGDALRARVAELDAALDEAGRVAADAAGGAAPLEAAE